MARYSIGVDFHKAYSYMTVMDAQGEVVKAGKVANTREAVQGFLSPYRDNAEAVLEATRNWTVMYDLLELEVRAVHLAHPLKVRAIAEARIKTDRIDSKILAHLLRCDLLPTAYVRPRAERVSQQIRRQRMFLVRVRTMVKNRIHVAIDRHLDVRDVAAEFSDLFGTAGLAWLRGVALPEVERQLLNGELTRFEAVQARIAESDGLIRTLATGDPRAVGAHDSGPRPLLCCLGVHEIGNIRRFPTSDNLSAYAGLVPSVHASGGKIFHGRLTKQGNKWLRWAVIEAVRPAVTTYPDLRRYYERLRLRKGPNPAVATARRLLLLAHRVLSQERPYRKPDATATKPRSRTAL